MDDFFDGIDQVEVNFEGGVTRSPTFYRRSQMFSLLLPANWFRLREMMPDVRFIPAQIFPGVGGILLSAFEYGESDLGPYEEFSVSVMLNAPYYAPVPCYNSMRQWIDRTLSVCIVHLPLTSDAAMETGKQFFNFPKFKAGIEFGDMAGRVTCDLTRGDERILTMSVAKLATEDMGGMKMLVNLYQNGQPQRTEFVFRLNQGVATWLPQMVNWSFNPATDVGAQLCGAVIGGRALLSIYVPEMNGILYGPEELSPPVLRRMFLSMGHPGKPVKAAARPARGKAAKKAAAKKTVKKASAKKSSDK